MGKKNDNNSFFIRDIDVIRAVLQAIFVYGCYNQKLLADMCGYKEDKNKNARKFYDACLANHIGSNYMIDPVKKKGRPSSATYMNYRRFANNKNYLFSVYQWVSIPKTAMFKYFVARQYIKKYYDSKDDYDLSYIKSVKEEITELLVDHNFNDYFSICKSRDYEHVYKFLNSVCKKDDIKSFIDSLCDALSLYSRKAPYSVPAYSVMSKLRRAYIFEEEDVFGDSEIWDFTYDNYDKILYDDTVYTVIQAIRKGQIISYTRSYGSKNYQQVIPLKIMNEYNLGRCYLICGRPESEKIHTIRFDEIFEVRAYYVKEEEKSEHLLKIQRLKEHLNTEKNIWISGDYTQKNKELSVTVKIKNKEALAYIKKYAPYYEIKDDNKTVVFTLRKADDIKPFLRRLGEKAIISESENPLLYKEFSKDCAEINEQYIKKQDYLDTKEEVVEKVEEKITKKEKVWAKQISDKYVEDTKILKLFNRYNSYFNIMLEDIQEYFINDILLNSSDVDIVSKIRESFLKCGFNVETEYYRKMLKRFVGDMKGIENPEAESDESDESLADKVFVRIVKENTDSKSNDQIFINACWNLKADEAENDHYDYKPVQIFTDYEYEYLYLMLQDREARSIIPDDFADKMLEKLGEIEAIKNSSLKDIFVTRYDNRSVRTDIRQLHKNIIPVADAIHNNKKITFTYKEKRVTGSPYRLMYSLRERVPQLMIKCDDETWIRKINIDKMKNVNMTTDDDISNKGFEKLLSEKKKYIEIVIHKTKEVKEKNVFERALRLFSSYEKYTWDDMKNNDYIIAVVYYDFDVLLKKQDDKIMYRSDTIVSDILSLGKYAKILGEARYELPEKNSDVTYDRRMYKEIKKIYRRLDESYNNQT